MRTLTCSLALSLALATGCGGESPPANQDAPPTGSDGPGVDTPAGARFAHATNGCSAAAFVTSGGRGSFYCFSAD